jgi:DNA adenine methylase
MNKPEDCKSLTPLRTPGGKSKVVKKMLAPRFPEEFSEYYEPFIGGGSVALFVAQMYPDKKIHINDLNTKLYEFWLFLKHSPDELVKSLHSIRDAFDPEDEEKGKELLERMTEALYEGDGNLLKVAASYYVLNKISFSGMTEHASLSKSAYKKTFNHKNIDRLPEIASHMKNFEIKNEHFIYPMVNAEENDFTFLDPPYMIESSNLYGKNGEMHKDFDHELFLNSVKDLKGKFMITYNDNEWLRDAYKDYNIEVVEYKYYMAFETDEEGNKKTRNKNELIITNY